MFRSTTPPRARCACVGFLLVAVAACAPTRSELFDPVRGIVRQRSGLAPGWRDAPARATGKDARALLARPLSAQSAAQLALLGNPELQASYAQLGVAGGDLQSANTPQNPELSAQLVFPLEGGEPEAEFHATQDVGALLGLFAQGRAASAQLAAARRNAAAATLEIGGRAKQRFYQAVAADQQLQLRRVFTQAAQASAELATGLRAAGNLTELDSLRQSVFHEESQVALEQATTDAASAREALRLVLGIAAEPAQLQLPPELPDLPDALGGDVDLERVATARNLQLEGLRYTLQAAEHGLDLAQLQSWPQLALGVAVKHEHGFAVGPAVGISLPLFDFGGGKRDAARARIEALQHGYVALEQRVRSSARDAALRLRTAHERAQRLLLRVLPMRAKLLDQGLRQYNAMNLDTFSLLGLRREQLMAQERAIEALRDYWLARTDVELLRAGVLPGERASTAFDAGIEAGSSGEGHGAPGRGH